MDLHVCTVNIGKIIQQKVYDIREMINIGKMISLLILIYSMRKTTTLTNRKNTHDLLVY